MAGYSYELEAVLERADPVARRFESGGFRFFLVGGVVRDYFLGRSSVGQDLDATTDARPDAIRALVADLADEVWLQGERFGTVGCVIAGQSYEITTHRTESYEPDSRRPSVVFGDDVVEDLARRDFTVNAMAIDMADHSLVDPFGGRADLEAGVLRTPLEPEVSLSEDPLRILRAARFVASCALSAAPELVAAMSAEAGRLEIVSAERIRDELQKLLMLDDPAAGLRLIDESGVGGLVPVVGAVDPWESAASRVRAVRQDPAMRWAAMLSVLQAGTGPAAGAGSGAESGAGPGAGTEAGSGPEQQPGVGSGLRAGSRARQPPENRGEQQPGVGSGLRALKFSGATARAIRWFLVDGCALAATDLASLSDSRFRELALRCPAGRRLEDLLAFVSGLRLGDGRPAGDVDAALERLTRLRAREPDLDDPVPIFGGLEVADLLGIEPGPELGRALDFLVGLRVAEGPLDPAVAERRLRAWWSESQSS